jgi:hypothetical protein
VAALFDKAIIALRPIKHESTEAISRTVVETKQSVLQCVGTAAEWFEPGDERFVAPMEIATVLSAAYRASQETLSPRRLNVNFHVQKTPPLRHMCIRPMFMLTNIMLENAVTHCGADRVEVELNLEVVGDSLVYSSVSSCAQMTTLELEEKRRLLREHVARVEAEVLEHAEKDKSSGIAKMIKLITSDMGATTAKHRIEYLSQAAYSVVFEIPTEQVLI